MTVPFRMAAVMYELGRPRKPAQNGRPLIRQWYEMQRPIELTTDKAIWYHSGQLAVPTRWVIVRNPLSKFKNRAPVCKDFTQAPTQIDVE